MNAPNYDMWLDDYLTHNVCPTVAVNGNLRWTTRSGVWADFLLTGLPFGLLAQEENDATAHAHRALAHLLPAYSLLSGLVVPISAENVISKMTNSKEIQRYPLWRTEAEAQYKRMQTWQMRGREFWLSIPLDPITQWGKPTPTRGGSKQPSHEEICDYHTRAAAFLESCPRGFHPRPVTEEMITWLWERSLTLGIAAVPRPRAQQESSFRATGRGAFTRAVFDDGARLDTTPKWWHRFVTPPQAEHPVLRVSRPWTTAAPTSYQVWHVIESWPPYRLEFPGSEIFSLLDDLDFDVDWNQRLVVKERYETEEWIRKNRNALTAVRLDATQGDEENQDEEDFTDRINTLKTYRREFKNNDTEKELRFLTVLSVAGATPEIAHQRSEKLIRCFAEKSIRLAAPKGDQLQLAIAANPGADPRSIIVEEFLTTTLTHEWAKIVPLTATTLGDRDGPVIARRIDTTRGEPVHHDPGKRAIQNQPVGVLLVGPPGGGKSVTLKIEATYAVMRGGVAGMIDPSDHGEYEDWLKVIAPLLGGPELTTLFNFADQKHSLDPARIFRNPTTRARWLETVLLGLFGLDGKSDLGRALRHILRATYWAEHEITSIAELDVHLQQLTSRRENTTSEASDTMMSLARFFEDWRELPFAQCFFNPDLPPLDIYTPQVTVFRTRELKMPDDVTLTNAHLYAEIPDFERFGRYAGALVCAILEDICFRDKSQPAIACFDELPNYYNIATEAVFERFTLQGRKNNAIPFYATQLIEAVPEFLTQNTPSIMAFKHKRRAAARRTLTKMDYPAAGFEEMATLLVSGLSPADDPTRKGEFLYHDDNGHHGLAQSILPAIKEIADACLTTPTQKQTVA